MPPRGIRLALKILLKQVMKREEIYFRRVISSCINKIRTIRGISETLGCM